MSWYTRTGCWHWWMMFRNNHIFHHHIFRPSIHSDQCCTFSYRRCSKHHASDFLEELLREHPGHHTAASLSQQGCPVEMQQCWVVSQTPLLTEWIFHDWQMHALWWLTPRPQNCTIWPKFPFSYFQLTHNFHRYRVTFSKIPWCLWLRAGSTSDRHSK